MKFLLYEVLALTTIVQSSLRNTLYFKVTSTPLFSIAPILVSRDEVALTGDTGVDWNKSVVRFL